MAVDEFNVEIEGGLYFLELFLEIRLSVDYGFLGNLETINPIIRG